MLRNDVRALFLLAVFAIFTPKFSGATEIVANDNRSPAGEQHNDVVTIHLEIDEGQWHPETHNGEGVRVYAFGETARPLQIPGPLIRAQQGTEIHAYVHNALSVSAVVHGLDQRPGEEKNAVALKAGATQEVRFQAGAPGTYYYWATTTGNPIMTRSTVETELSGAFIVDPPGAVVNDRVFVLGLWYTPIYRERPGLNFKNPTYREIATINGKSWPYTERVDVHMGAPAHWRWVNPTVSGHAMHLHGFYFHTDSLGDAERMEVLSEGERPFGVTQHVKRGQTFDMTWVPDRSGRWLFHCHMIGHMSPPDITPTATHAASHAPQEMHAGMGGMVLGVTVLPDKEAPKPVAWHAERKLQLVIEEHRSGRPLYALTLHDPAQPSSSARPGERASFIGPPIILTQGQPVEIEVVNRMNEATAIHWHGMELESYYDGVPNWAGTVQQMAPPILPGKSFIARMTPPRAGTFIYHTHWHDMGQMKNGVYGPLIVLPHGQSYDPETDKTFVFGVGTFEPFGDMFVVNGNPQPYPMELKVGTKYRFRFIHITPDEPGMRAKLLRSGEPVEWRVLAKDGADLLKASKPEKADLTIALGETFDVEFEAKKPEELALEALLPDRSVHAEQALIFSAK